jgi:hypothetical protein
MASAGTIIGIVVEGAVLAGCGIGSACRGAAGKLAAVYALIVAPAPTAIAIIAMVIICILVIETSCDGLVEIVRPRRRY